MTTRLIILMVLTAALSSCTKSRYATVGAYESDDAYYTSDDTYISDFALVDDEAQLASSNDSAAAHASSDDYYDPNYVSPFASATPTYNSNWTATPWNYGSGCANSFGSGFGNYQYGSYWNCAPYAMPGIGWNPYTGYYSGFQFGYNPYYNPYLSYNPYNSWYSPYYGGNYYSGWAYNPWYSPYNYASHGNNDSGSISTVIHGPRNPISTMSATNASYSSGLFYGSSKRDIHSYVNTLAHEQAMGERVPVALGPKPLTTSIKRPETLTKPSSPRPTFTPAKPQHERIENRPKPVVPRVTTPKPARSQTDPPVQRDSGRSSTPKTEKPHREFTQPSRNDNPIRETPRSTPRTESPARSSGGSTNSPRRK